MKKIRVNAVFSDPEYGAAVVRGMSAVSRRMEFFQVDPDTDFAGNTGAAEGCTEEDPEEEGLSGQQELWLTDCREIEVIDPEKTLCISLPGEPVPDEASGAGHPPEAQSSENSRSRRTSEEDRIWNRKKIMDGLNRLWYQQTGMPAEYFTMKGLFTVSFCSVCGGSGVTACALACAQMLARQYGKWCLYLNMAAVDDSGNYLHKSEDEQMIRLFYSLKQGRHVPIRPYLREEDGIWFFSAGRCGLGGKLRDPDIELLFREIRRQENFDYVILDFGNSLSELHLKMIQCSDAVLIVGKGPLSERPVFQQKWEQSLRKRFSNAVMLQNMDDGEDEVFRTFCDAERDAEEDGETKDEESRGSTGENRAHAGGKEFRVSCCREAFIRMGGRWKIDLSGCLGIELGAVAEWLEEKR